MKNEGQEVRLHTSRGGTVLPVCQFALGSEIRQGHVSDQKFVFIQNDFKQKTDGESLQDFHVVQFLLFLIETL